MGSFEEVLGPLAVLRARVTEVMARHGLQVLALTVVPGDSAAGPHGLNVAVVLAPEPGTETTSELNAEFERVLYEASQAELEKQSTEALDDLRRRLDDQRGFLD